MATFITSGLAVVTALATSAITVSNGAVSFEATDSAALDTGVSNGIANLWAGFTFVLPYVAVFLGIGLVISVIMSKLGGRGR